MIRRVLMGVLIIASFAFLIHQFLLGVDQLGKIQWRILPIRAGFSFVLLIVNFLIISWSWAPIFRDRNEPAPLSHLFSIIYTGQIGRYLPGKVWMFYGQVHTAEQLGYSARTTLTAAALQNYFGFPATFGVLSVAALGAGRMGLVLYASVAICFGFLIVGLAAPRWIERLFNRIRQRQGKDAIYLAVSRAAMLKTFLILVLAWVELCFAFTVLCSSFVVLESKQIFMLAFAFPLAYTAGYLALIVPGGIGVREGTLTAILGPAIGSAPAGLIAIFQRLWFTVAEAVSFFVSKAIVARTMKIKKADPIDPPS